MNPIIDRLREAERMIDAGRGDLTVKDGHAEHIYNTLEAIISAIRLLEAQHQILAERYLKAT